MARKTAREKLNNGQEPQVGPMCLERQIKMFGPGTMLVPTPLQVDAMIREIPSGTVVKMDDLRSELARRNGADVTCPLCTGIFWRISAEAYEEDPASGAPYWRVVKPDLSLNPKLPGGVEAHAAKLRAEGVQVEAKGKTARVAPAACRANG